MRELLNIVERATILCRGQHITVALLPAAFSCLPGRDNRLSNDRPDGTQLQALLTQHAGNRSALARQLGVNRTTLWRWIKEHDLP
ncbi:MAG: helix-turn-helix domain-containing protein [Syntrophotaleaceae bacterium]